MGSTANAQGLVTITAPIAGTVASRDVSIGQSLQDAGGKLMTIINDGRIFATANIYEKDLGLVKNGQKIRVKVAALPNQSFEGRITQIGTSVQGETRVVPVQAEISNPSGLLKPGMFAELEVITDKTAASLLAIPTSAVVDANGKKVVYVQNGNAFQAADVTLGRTTGDMVEVNAGLFAGDMVVTQRGTQLYAQSLQGGSEKTDADGGEQEEAPAKSNGFVTPSWLLPVGGGLVLVTGGALLLRKRFRSAPADGLEDGEEDAYADSYRDSLPAAELPEPESYTNNHHSVPSSPVLMGGKSKEGAQE